MNRAQARTLVVAVAGGHKASQPWREALARLLPDFRVVDLAEAGGVPQADYLVAWQHPRGSFSGFGSARAIFSLGAGVDHLLSDPALPPGVPIVRVVDPDLTARMSEYFVAQVLFHHRQVRRYLAQQRECRWDDDAAQPAARQVRVGVMGLGVLGRDAAAKLHMLGFDVAGWSRRPKHLPGMKSFAGEAERDAFLAHAQILVVILPLTPQTRGILDASLFRRLARDGHFGAPILINAGRGGLQVEADILRCLDDGTLHAVTLDVFEQEPLPTSSPLWRHPAVTVTPHNAAISNPATIAAYIAGQIRAHEAGAPLEHVVDRERAY